MQKFWDYLTAFRIGLSNILFLLVFVIFIGVLGFSGGSSEIEDSSILRINPDGIIVEQKTAISPLNQLTGGGQQNTETLARDVVKAINTAKTDDDIKGIFLDLSGMEGGSMPLLNSIGKALEKFRETQKPVYAYGLGYSQSQYFLASFADKIYLNSSSFHFSGGLSLDGLGVYPLYMKSALEKLKINAIIIKAGDYKSAGETFVRDQMSDFAKEANQKFVDDLWKEFLKVIAANRKMSLPSLEKFVNEMPKLVDTEPYSPSQLLIETGLLDAVLSNQDWKKKLEKISGKEKEDRLVSYRDYLRARGPETPDNYSDKIAVIIAKGEILTGDHPAGTIGGASLSKLIKQAKEDSSIKAVVLRIDSGGGSAEASEQIRVALSELQRKGIPVVISMGQVSASGGYWISATADKIFAESTTITGSIGVITMIATLENSLEFLGLNVDGVGSTDFADPYNPLRAPNPSIIRLAELSVNEVYRKFISLVADGRNMPIEQVDSLAQGRVWSASDALTHNLIDEIGDLEDAVAAAGELAGIENWDRIYLEKEKTSAEKVIEEIINQAAGDGRAFPGMRLREAIKESEKILNTMDSPQILLRCLECNIRL